MDDLYAILRISPSASASEIESRLSSVSAYEAARIRAILLVEARRKAYDKAHQAMMRTSILRYALRVTNTANWPQSLQQRWLGDPISKKDHSNSITGRKTRRYPSILKKVKEALKFLVALALFVLLGAAAINLVVKGCSKLLGVDQAPTESMYRNATPNVSTTSEPTSNAVAPPEDLSDTLPRPRSGTVFKRRGNGVAPFEVTVPEGLDSYIKVVNPETGAVVCSFYVRASDKKKIAVPIGKFHVYVNTGAFWYGTKKGFGPNSGRNRLIGDFEFYSDTPSRTMGHTIILGPVTNGNLSLEKVDQSRFDDME
ncbi:MAG: hypothetical protein IPI24_13370 [Ignavibacteria bacterium]|nr:hypothetical protein [Ignavibacteria bacterium]